MLRKTRTSKLRTMKPTGLATDDTAAKVEKAKLTGDLAKLQGTWEGMGGPNKDTHFTLILEGNKATLVFEAGGEQIKVNGEFKLDEKAAPKTIDWTKFTAPGGDAIGDNMGIYKLEGDKLTLCSGGPGNERPTEFKEGDGGPPNLSVVTRVKDKDKEKKAEGTELKGDLAKLQGSWTTKAHDRTIAVEFKGNKVTSKSTEDDGKAMSQSGEVVLNEEAKLKTIDFVKGKRIDGDSIPDVLGLYRVEGDKVIIAVGSPGKPRPSEFKADEAEGVMLLTLEMVK